MSDVATSERLDDLDVLEGVLADAGRGGKRFRPALLAQAHRLLGGTDERALAQVAQAVEMLHTAFVVHDDVIDGDDVRRGRPSARGAFAARAGAAGARAEGAAAYAVAGGLLVGDLALADAIRLVATAPVARPVMLRLLELVDHTLRVSAAGELADVRLATWPEEPSLDEVLRTAERKTAVYSFSLPLQAGAVLAGADDVLVAGLGDVGRALGLAYQLHDDLLGVFGDPARTGKSGLGDLREGKRTALVVHARTTAAWPQVRRHLGDPALTEDDAARVRALLDSCGARAFVAGLVGDYLAAATAQAAALGLPTLVDGLAGRLGDLRLRPVEGAA